MMAATLVSAIRLRSGTEEAHRRLHDRAVAHARRLGGLASAELVRAIPGVQPETVALLTFCDRGALDRWLGDTERAATLDAMAELAEGDRTLTVIGDFGGWFSPREVSQPARWRQAATVVMGLVPVSLAVTVVLEQLLPSLPLPARVVLTAIVNVSILTWLVMPALTKVLSPWLSR